MQNGILTTDVRLTGDDCKLTFKDLPLSPHTVEGLRIAGFVNPSPVQAEAIPLAKFGNDVIVQAKSGTGKTCVFSTITIEQVQTCKNHTQVLIISPTREIAVQISEVIRLLSQNNPSIQCAAYIGGLSINSDKESMKRGCHIVVGTPGRVKFLIDSGVMDVSHIRLFVIDEFDKLMKDDFLSDMQAIHLSLPQRKQVLAFSATTIDKELDRIANMMRSPKYVRISGNSVEVQLVESNSSENQSKVSQSSLWLKGVKQYYCIIPNQTHSRSPLPLSLMKSKVLKLHTILTQMQFHQCFVFCNDKTSTKAIASTLNQQGWPTACIIGNQPQSQRLEIMKSFRQFELRVLVSTDLTARGIDVHRVDLVVNMDIPLDPASYLHRVGRTGRFGSSGSAITLVSEKELNVVHSLGKLFSMTINSWEPISNDIQDSKEIIEDSKASRDYIADPEVDPSIHESEHTDESMSCLDEPEVDESCSYLNNYIHEERCYDDWIANLDYRK